MNNRASSPRLKPSTMASRTNSSTIISMRDGSRGFAEAYIEFKDSRGRNTTTSARSGSQLARIEQLSPMKRRWRFWI